MARPFVDWSQFKPVGSLKTEPEIVLRQEQDEDTYGEIFRNLSHKVSGCRYDVPWGSQVLIAYCQKPDCTEPPHPVGVISFKLANEMSEQASHQDSFLSSSFHVISFIFVDQMFQRKGVGRRLMSEALHVMKESGIQYPVHLEGAKRSLKFFHKMGFRKTGDTVSSLSRGSKLFHECFCMQYQFRR